MGLRSYFLMRDLKDDMQSMLNLDDGYESSNASETIRNCKNEQRGYDITSHSGMDVMRFYKRLLERYRDALKMETNRLYSLKSEAEEKLSNMEGIGISTSAGTLGGIGLALIPGGFPFGLGIAAASMIVDEVREKEARNLERAIERYKKKTDERNEYIQKTEQIEKKYDLQRLWGVCWVE
jgi:hypothetical protein